MPRKILFLFPQEWDYSALNALGDEFEFVFEGFDIFKFPENANLLWFNVRKYIDKLARNYGNASLAGVMSTNEQYGALINVCKHIRFEKKQDIDVGGYVAEVRPK